jgi:hypothetical protein
MNSSQMLLAVGRAPRPALSGPKLALDGRPRITEGIVTWMRGNRLRVPVSAASWSPVPEGQAPNITLDKWRIGLNGFAVVGADLAG